MKVDFDQDPPIAPVSYGKACQVVKCAFLDELHSNKGAKGLCADLLKLIGSNKYKGHLNQGVCAILPV